MAHKLTLLTKKLNNTPLLIEPASFESILEYLSDRNTGEMAITASHQPKQERHLNFNQDTMVGLIEIDGALTYKTTGWEAFCGGTSYESIVEQFNAMSNQGMKTLVLWADSGGGEAYAMMETGRYLRKQADEMGIQIITYVDGLSASACYGITCIADRVVMNPNSEAGSIGVVVRLMNDSKALEKAGYERTFVYAGGNKVPFEEGGEFRKDFLDDIQYKVDSLYEEFTGYVSEMRNIPVDQVKSTEAKVFMAEDAVSLGLADVLMTHEEFSEYLADIAQKDNRMISKSKLFNFSKQAEDEITEEVQMKELEELQAQHSALETKFTAQEAELVAQLEKVTSLSAELAQVKEELSASIAEKEAVLAKAEVEKVAKRKASIAEVEKDSAKAYALYESIGELSEAAFNTVINSLQAKEEKLEDSDLFTQKSKNTEVEETVAENATSAILKAKYQNQ